MCNQPDEKSKSGASVCPSEYSRFLVTKLRRLLQNPDKLLGSMINKGQTVLDVGCGPGFFSLAMARIVGENGSVIAADLQEEMLAIVRSRAETEGVESRILLHQCQSDSIGLNETVDFALAFYMVHEVPDSERFLREIYSILKPGGKLLLVEPKFHVTHVAFNATVDLACAIGFEPVSKPAIMLSRSVLLKRN